MIKKKNISQEDINVWENYTKNPTDVTDKDKIQKNIKSRHNRFKYDLHGFTLDEANKKIKQIILSCFEKGYKEILLITGKGIHSNTDKDAYVSKNLSKLKYSIPEFINSNSNLLKHVLSITNAKKEDGGEGAIIIKLKKL